MRRGWVVPAVLAGLILLAAALVYTGALQLNQPPQPVRGVDVSHWQGEIDWPALAAGLRVGAYHFFSYDSSGADQAAHFIANVPSPPGALPPVIDVEFYGDYFRHPADRGVVVPQLRAMVDALTQRYGRPPMIYATKRSYSLYIAGGFEDCDIWIRSVLTAPRLPDGRDWTLWQ